MKNIHAILTACSLALATLPPSAHGATLVFYNGNNGPPSYTTVNGPNTVAPGIENASPIRDADGTLVFPAPFPKFSATSFDDGNSFLFSFSVAQGSQVALTDFFFDDQGTSSGPTSWTLSINGQFIKSGAIKTTLGSESAALAMSGLTGIVSFQLFANGATSHTAAYSIDSVQVNGTVSAVPEPSDIVLAAMGIGLLLLVPRYRRQQPICTPIAAA